MTAPAAPLTQILQTYGIRRIDLAAASGCDLKTLTKLERGRYSSLMVSTLVRVAHALGVAPSELVPGLAFRHPGRGLVGEAQARQRAAHGNLLKRIAVAADSHSVAKKATTNES